MNLTRPSLFSKKPCPSIPSSSWPIGPWRAAYHQHRRLSRKLENIQPRTLELIQKHPERVSERDRYFIEQNYYAFARPEPEWGKSLEAGRKLLALYPDDPSGNYGMGVIYADIEDWDEALKYYEKCVDAKYRFASDLYGHG